MSRNWRDRRESRAFLALADGTVLHGHSVGAQHDAVGEVVFNTGMSGYQEILSDPSYCGQFVTMTYPEIGNTGINCEDMESRGMFLNGLVLHEMNEPSSWRHSESLQDALVRYAVPAIAGIDTRMLTRLLREKGTLKGFMSVTQAVAEDESVARAETWEGLDNQDYASGVSCRESYEWDEDGSVTCSWGITDEVPAAEFRVVAYDFGIKWNILRSMRRSGMAVTVVPAKTSAADVLAMSPDGVFLSNGPADPEALGYAIDAARSLLGKVPVMGICLGHQILGIATGGRKYRLKFGHHGCNHPVKALRSGKVEITSQNHNFAIDADSVDTSKLEITHVNLNDGTVEGIAHKTEPMFSVQYHPEACPGPHDPFYLFAQFKDLMCGA